MNEVEQTWWHCYHCDATVEATGEMRVIRAANLTMVRIVLRCGHLSEADPADLRDEPN